MVLSFATSIRSDRFSPSNATAHSVHLGPRTNNVFLATLLPHGLLFSTAYPRICGHRSEYREPPTYKIYFSRVWVTLPLTRRRSLLL